MHCVIISNSMKTRDLREAIEMINADLDKLDRDIIKMVGQGYRLVEIAELLGVHRNSVRNRLNRIKRLIMDKEY